MSGSRRAVELAIGGPDARAVAELLTATREAVAFMGDQGRRPVVIGGVAVMARVAVADRATADLDSALAATPDGPATVELLEEAGIGERVDGSPQRISLRGTVIDCIDTLPVTDRDLHAYDAKDALFIGGHRFAHDSAEDVVLRAADARLEVAVAVPAGLVATKAHAVQYRRQAEKRGSDIFDLCQLLHACDPVVIAREIARWPTLAGLVRGGVATALLRDPTRAMRWLREGSEAMRRVTEDTLEVAGERFIAALDEALDRQATPDRPRP